MRRKVLGPLSVLLSEPHHLPDMNYDLSEGEPVLLLFRNFCFHGESQRIYEGKKVFVVPGYEIARQPDSRDWGVFHKRFGGRKASPVAPGCCLSIEADRECGLV